MMSLDAFQDISATGQPGQFGRLEVASYGT